MIRITLPAAGLVLSALLATAASAQTIQINRENKTIAISATDEATATADISAVSIGFEVYGPDSDSTYADGGRISHAVLDALHKIGVEDKSIESSNQGLERYSDFDNKDTADQRAQKQFVFRQSWEVSVAPQAAAEVIRAAVAAGANKSGNIEWRLADRKALQAKAAEAALVKARAIASNMAEGLHVKLGDLIYASNETPNSRLFFPLAKGVLNPEGLAGAAGSVIPAPPLLEIRPQTMREEATVYAVFAIE